MLDRRDFKDHQHRLSKFIIESATTGGCLCFLGMGAGKTGATIDALNELRSQFLMHKTLVVSTKRVIDFVWPNELLVWEQAKNFKVIPCSEIVKAKTIANSRVPNDLLKKKRRLDVTLRSTSIEFIDRDDRLEYNKIKRMIKNEQLDYLKGLDGDIYLINVGQYAWLQETLGDDWFFDTQVFDESSLFRNPANKRFKAAKKTLKYSKTSICLTGTPKPRDSTNLWSQTYLVDKGERLGKNITSFRGRYTYQIGFSYVMREYADAEIRQKISDITISLNPSDFMDISKEPIHENYSLEFSMPIEKKYKELEKDFILSIEETDIIAASKAALWNKLKQICNGMVYNEDKEAIFIHDIKMKALSEIVEAHFEQPLIVVYEYNSEKEAILKEFPEAIHMDDFNQKDWDNQDIPMLVTHPRSGGHGLNLQHGGHILVWYSTCVDLELYDQMNARIGEVRQSQSEYNVAPLYYHLFIKGSIEERIIKLRNKKHKGQKELLEALANDYLSRSI